MTTGDRVARIAGSAYRMAESGAVQRRKKFIGLCYSLRRENTRVRLHKFLTGGTANVTKRAKQGEDQLGAEDRDIAARCGGLAAERDSLHGRGLPEREPGANTRRSGREHL